MTLQATGRISIADIRAELETTGRRTLAQADGRNLAGVASGRITLSNYYGKSSSTNIVNVGQNTGIFGTTYGFESSGLGTCSPQTWNGSTIIGLWWGTDYTGRKILYLGFQGNSAVSFTSIKVNNTTFNYASANVYSGGYSFDWVTNTNPFTGVGTNTAILII